MVARSQECVKSTPNIYLALGLDFVAALWQDRYVTNNTPDQDTTTETITHPEVDWIPSDDWDTDISCDQWEETIIIAHITCPTPTTAGIGWEVEIDEDGWMGTYYTCPDCGHGFYLRKY